MLVRVTSAKVICVVRVRVSLRRHDREYIGAAFCCRFLQRQQHEKANI